MRTSADRRTPWLAFLGLTGLLAGGCGYSGGTLAGRVTVDGNPLANGILMVHDARGGMRSAPVIAGAYELEGVPLGPARLTVRALPPPPMIAPPPSLDGGRKSSAAGPEFAELPESYADAERSGLKVDVTSGRQRHDIAIRSRAE
jgi:hypothetical protein